MIDTSKQMKKFHDEEVDLPTDQRKKMQQRRDTNRDALTSGLQKKKNPDPKGFASQGSYMMRTMVQTPEDQIDIDDGVYFKKSDLVGEKGADKTALDARKMVCEALTNGRSFKTPPEVKPNCVRVYYEEGYHVDVPVYRLSEGSSGSGEVAELASTDWKVSDARGVTAWFNDVVSKQSPSDDDEQLRRIVRLLKKFSVSRSSWVGKSASGFAISKLVQENYYPSAGRDDESLRVTMRRILRRLEIDTVVKHPILSENITKKIPDPKTTFLKDCLSEREKDLDQLEISDCSFEQAMKAWSAIFNTDFFNEQPDPSDSGKKSSAFETSGTPGVVIKGGNSDYA
ncbi:hypothetical protein GETHLI_34150 [Geothrix limicola]|uniref:Cyclic GMP-AMP synthase n=1 Tax=Geothrix limicola TaxID=2927978 RepID=A0ABQ5QK45_9BACT|nr:hypothetical protein [Geothrix limicola]GLH74913.1 hypothetical protein GETHLI_34150 [Geothrix limicola]